MSLSWGVVCGECSLQLTKRWRLSRYKELPFHTSTARLFRSSCKKKEKVPPTSNPWARLDPWGFQITWTTLTCGILWTAGGGGASSSSLDREGRIQPCWMEAGSESIMMMVDGAYPSKLASFPSSMTSGKLWIVAGLRLIRSLLYPPWALLDVVLTIWFGTREGFW